MKKVLLVSGILLFILGSTLLLGAYFVFNQYSATSSNHFEYLTKGWQTPESPLELAEGDKVTVRISMTGSGSADFYIVSTHGRWQLGKGIGIGNSTLYYYVQTNDFYYCSVDIMSIGLPAGLTIKLNLEVTRNAPNLPFLFIGAIVVLAGVVTIPIAVLYKSKKELEKQPNERPILQQGRNSTYMNLESDSSIVTIIYHTSSSPNIVTKLPSISSL